MGHIDFISGNLNSEYCICKNEAASGDHNYYPDISLGKSHIKLLAGFKIFTFVMLQLWRKGRNEIKQLKYSLENFRKSSIQIENQNRMYGTLIHIEQTRNNKLTAQLRRTLDHLKPRTKFAESISMAFCDLKNKKTLLEATVKNKYEELDVVYEVLSQTKRELFHSVMEQRKLQTHLCQEQRFVQFLKNQITMLVSEICDLNLKHRDMKENLMKQIESKDCEIKKANQQLQKYRSILLDVNNNFKECVKNYKDIDLQLMEFNDMPKDSSNLISGQSEKFWTQFLKYPKTSLRYIYLFSYYLLPAMPPPTKY